MTPRMERIGVIGTGEIGQALAINALQAGYSVVVYDLRAELTAKLAAHGAKIAATAGAVAASADIVQVVVMNDAQVEQGLCGANGALAAARPATIFLIHSTVHPRTIQAVAAEAERRGVTVLDAPVTDPFGVHGIETRTASFLLGGAVGTVEKVRPLLELSAQRVYHLGPLGSGATAKLIRNLTMYVTLLAAHESRALAAAAGLDRATLREILSSSGASSAAMDHFLSRTVYDDAYRNRLPALIEIFQKDIALALDLAAELGVQVPGGKLTREQIPQLLAESAK